MKKKNNACIARKLNIDELEPAISYLEKDMEKAAKPIDENWEEHSGQQRRGECEGNIHFETMA